MNRSPFLFSLLLALTTLQPFRLCLADTSNATPEVRIRGDYPANLIYGGGNLGGLGCPGEDRPACAHEWAEYLYDFGLRSTRKSLSWFDVEGERGTYDWSSPDGKIPPMVEQGFTVVALITGTPLWASNERAKEILHEEGKDRFSGCLPNEPEFWPDYERWLEAAIIRYKDVLDYYELWNEPDGMCGLFLKYWEGRVGGIGVGGDPVWYTELLKRTATIIRALDPGAKVAVGGFEDKRGLQTDFVKGIYENGGQPYFDAICIHPYGDPFKQPFDRKWLATVRRLMADHGDAHKPFWITEYNNEGHNELDMSFTVRRKHRLLRETPWITIAIPLGTQYMFYGKDAINWPLRAIRQMEAEEFEARTAWKQDFEGSASELLANWEWRARPIGDKEWPEIGIRPDEGREYSQALYVQGKPNNKRIRVHFLPYVRSNDPQFGIWYRVMPQNAESVVSLAVGMECLDILEPVRSTDIIAQVSDEYEYKPLHFRLADHWPDWTDKGINMFWVEFSCPERGFAIAIDDVEVF